MGMFKVKYLRLYGEYRWGLWGSESQYKEPQEPKASKGLGFRV